MPQSYKIFIKDVPLVLANSHNSQIINGFTALHNFNERSVNEIIDSITKNGSENLKGYYFLHEQPDTLFELIRNRLDLIKAAGGIVWNRNKELLMIYRRGKWDLPKGKIEEGE